MNILYIRESFDSDELSGGAIVARFLCKELAGRDHRVFVVAGKAKPSSSVYEITSGIEISRPLTAGKNVVQRLLFAAKLYTYLVSFLQQHKIDVIYNHAYIPTLPATWAAAKFHIPVITTVHLFCGKSWFQLTNPITATLNYFMEIVILRLGKHTVVHCPSETLRKEVQRYVRVKSVTIPNPLDLNKITQTVDNINNLPIRENIGIKQDEQFILFVGSLVKVKNVDGLLKVLSNLKTNFKLVVVGDGPERHRIEKLVCKLGLNSRIILLGQKPHEETLRIMKSCDILILPSKSEVFPIVVLEAIALGKPVIATRVGGIAEINSENLYLVDDLKEINPLLEGVFEVKKEAMIIEEYSINTIADKFEELLLTQIDNYKRKLKLFKQ